MDGDTMYTCPVCSYPELKEPPSDWSICSCCGTEFENDDSNTSHTVLRQRWLSAGAPWFSRAKPIPLIWARHLEGVRCELANKLSRQERDVLAEKLGFLPLSAIIEEERNGR
jgi:hypothetical protein